MRVSRPHRSHAKRRLVISPHRRPAAQDTQTLNCLSCPYLFMVRRLVISPHRRPGDGGEGLDGAGHTGTDMTKKTRPTKKMRDPKATGKSDGKIGEKNYWKQSRESNREEKRRRKNANKVVSDKECDNGYQTGARGSEQGACACPDGQKEPCLLALISHTGRKGGLNGGWDGQEPWRACAERPR